METIAELGKDLSSSCLLIRSTFVRIQSVAVIFGCRLQFLAEMVIPAVSRVCIDVSSASNDFAFKDYPGHRFLEAVCPGHSNSPIILFLYLGRIFVSFEPCPAPI